MDSLAKSELKSLAECEAAIDRGLKSFIETGRALMTIREGRLYRATHATFEDYCRERWNINHQVADRTIRSAEVAQALNPIGFNLTESQARELVPLKDEPEAMAEAWQEAVRRTEGKPTAAVVRVVVQERLEPTEPRRMPDRWTCLACDGRGYLDHDPGADRTHKPGPPTWTGGSRPLAPDRRIQPV